MEKEYLESCVNEQEKQK